MAKIEVLPLFQNAPPKALAEFEKYAIEKRFNAGEMLAMEGTQPAYFFVVVSGSIRVYKPSDSGREITLYRVRPNESCVLTSFGLLSHTPFPAFAVAESNLTLLLIPADIIRDWVNRYEVWRKYIFENLTIRLQEIMQTIEKVAFQRLDTRLANYLLSHFPEDMRIIKITHEKLARELGSSRVPVSRVLEEFESNGWVKLSRGKIVLKDRAAMQKSLNGTR